MHPSANQVQSNQIDTKSTTMTDILSCFSNSKIIPLDTTQIPLVIDTGTIDHMICRASIYSFAPIKVSSKVKFPTCDLSEVTHT